MSSCGPYVSLYDVDARRPHHGTHYMWVHEGVVFCLFVSPLVEEMAWEVMTYYLRVGNERVGILGYGGMGHLSIILFMM